MKKPWLFAFAVLSLTACKPADKNVESVKARLDAGEVVEFTKPGYRRPSCRDNMPDWNDYRVGNEDERMRIVVRKQNSGLNAGAHSCFRVGTAVLINSPGDKGHKGGGLARITKLSLVKIDNLKKANLKGKYFASDEAFYAYKDNMKFRLKPDHQGVVTILDFDYVNASAKDEAALKQKDVEESSGDAYAETHQDGETISKCTKPWTDVIVPESEYQQAILSGKLLSYYNWGSRNCLAQGQTANVKSAFGETGTVLGSVKIAKVKIFRASYVDPKYFAASDFDLLKLKTKIQLENKDEFVTVMDFVPAAPKQGEKEQQKPGQKVGDCLPAGTSHLAVRTSADVVENGATTFTVLVDGKTCYREGDLVALKIFENDLLKDLGVRMLSQSYDEATKRSTLKVQRLETFAGAE